MGEIRNGIAEVRGSIPLDSTNLLRRFSHIPPKTQGRILAY